MKDIRVKHLLPDRIRFEMPNLKYNGYLAGVIEKVAKKHDGVHWARANAACASVTVRFDSNVHSSDSILELFENFSGEVG